MAEYKRVVLLVLVMTVAVAAATAVAIGVLYRTAFERERLQLISSAQGQARLMEAIARFDRDYVHDYPGAPEAATLAQISAAHEAQPGVGETAELTIGRRQGEEIVFLMRHRHQASGWPDPVSFASHLAEPMRRALSGQSGSMVGIDYHGERVLAAYEPVALLDLGVVAKVDLAEIRAPFLRAGLTVGGVALLLIASGTLLFIRLTRPMLASLRESERRYHGIFDGAEVALLEQDYSLVRNKLMALGVRDENELRAILAGDPSLVSRLLQAARIRDANAAALELVGAGSVEELTEWCRKESVEDSSDALVSLLCALWKGEQHFRAETVLRTLGGKRRRIIVSMLIPAAGQGFRSIPVSMLDVTSDALLQQREQELDLILASAGEGIFGVDLEGRCTFANRAAVQTLGYTSEDELLGKDMHALMHHTRTDGVPHRKEDCPVLRALRDARPVRLDDETLWRADGSSFPAEYRAYSMRREGNVVGAVATFVDISDRKEKELELLHAQKMELVGQLTGGISHDFNNLLTIILGNLRLLAEERAVREQPERQELVADALSAAQDGADLTRRLLALSRKQALQLERIEVNAFLREAQSFLHRATGEHIAVVLDLDETPLSVHSDVQQLHSAILNLTVNARDAMPTGGGLTIRTERLHIAATGADERMAPGTYVVIEVTDTGTGMSAEVAQRAVEPFFTTKAPGEGSGLGLSMVYGFAKQSGGDLRMVSGPGQGTSVSLYLPEAEMAAQAGVTPLPATRPSAGGKTILVVEDEPRLRRFAAHTLLALGYRVLTAENAAAARDVLEAEPEIDLLFSDIVMPGEMDGRALAQWALARQPRLEVLLTTGFSEQLREPAGADAAHLRVLEKPYTRETLGAAIGDLLDGQPSRLPAGELAVTERD